MKETIAKIKPLDERASSLAAERWDRIAKPLHGLGELETILIRIAGIQRTENIDIRKKALAVFCADNGVTAEGVSQTGQAVTAIVAENFLDKASCAALMCSRAGAVLIPYDVGMAVDTPRVEKRKLRYGTSDMAKGPAMSREEALRMIETGIRIAEELSGQYQLLGCGEMGIGNTTTSSAVVSVLLHREPREVTGRGAGLPKKRLLTKIAVIERAIQTNKPDPDDPVDVLSKVGGFDLAALTGFFLGAAAKGVPVVLDGFITAAAALAAVRLCPLCREYLIPSHLSGEPGTELVLDELSLHPILRAGMHLGEGTGAAALFPLLDMAADIYEKMETFTDIKVEQYEDFESHPKEHSEEEPARKEKRMVFLSYTAEGELLAKRAAERLMETESELQVLTYRHGKDFESTDHLLAAEWDLAEVLVFVSATGIAVRSTAPYLRSKAEDPAVLVMDTAGQHVISLLSGHLGGANAWCQEIAELLGAGPVITTATDLHGVFAVDLFAKQNHLWIPETRMIQEVSSRLLSGENVGICSDALLPEELPEGLIFVPEESSLEKEVLPRCGITILTKGGEAPPRFEIECRLYAKNLVLGLGCKKGKTEKELQDFILRTLREAKLFPERISLLASIDLKKEEEGILRLAEKWSLPYKTYSAEELNHVPGVFQGSEFVLRTTGTDSVAARSAVCAAGEGAVLLLEKKAEQGMTLSVAARRSYVTSLCGGNWSG